VSADIASAYRTCPIAPEHKPWLVSSTRHPQTREIEFWADHCCPFGMASAHGILGAVANATCDIIEAKALVTGAEVSATKWVDDFAFTQSPTGGGVLGLDGQLSPWTYAFADCDALLSIVSSLRIPWHESKGQAHFSSYVDYIGFGWDFALKTVALPEAKRDKYYGRTMTFLSSPTASLEDVLRLHRSLMHLTFVIPEGRSYLPALSSFASAFPSRETSGAQLTRRHYPPSVKHDLQWWASVLASPVPALALHRPRVDLDLGISVDASTNWGIGLIWQHISWDAWRSRPGWEGPGRHITWLECIAVELVVLILERRDVRDANVLVQSDNQGVIGAFAKGRCPSFEINLSVRRALSILAARNIHLQLRYVESARNPADPISRGKMGLPGDHFPSDISLPSELTPYFIRYEP
jgi:hypothetical protein